MTENDIKYLKIATEQARKSLGAGGVPVGACLVSSNGNLLATGHNERVQNGDPIAHGEMSCLRAAGRQRSYAGYTLYTTLSPCTMCRGAIELFQISRVVVGEAETFVGDMGALRSAGAEVVLADDENCKKLMRRFQEEFPEIWNEDIGVAS